MHYAITVFTKPNGKTIDQLLAPFDENLKIENSKSSYNPDPKWDYYEVGGR